MSPFTKTEIAILAPLRAAHTDAAAKADAAAAELSRVTAEQSALRDQLVALGGTPQPTDYDGAAAWQRARVDFEFAAANLQRDIDKLDGPIAAAGDAYREHAPSLAQALNEISKAEGAILNARLKIATKAVYPVAYAAAMKRNNQPTGFVPEWPEGIAVFEAGYGRVRLQFDLAFDPATAVAA